MLRVALAAMFVLCAWLGAAHAQALHPLPPQPAGLAWPTRAWESTPLPPDVDRAAYDLAVTEAFAGGDPAFGETRAVIVVQSGRIVFERYGDGYAQDMRFASGAMAQSITHALVGAAVLQGRVAIDAPMGSPYWRAGDRRASIPWRQWLGMVDGQGDAARAALLYGDGRANTARFAANVPLVRDPGLHWHESATGAVLMADALTRIVVSNPRDADDRRARMRGWMQDALFARIGMSPVVEFDPAGLYYASSSIWAAPRDFARLGYLYLRDGVWDGARVLPEGWVDFARSQGPDAHADIHGAQWWLTPAFGHGAPERALIQNPRLADVFFARGEGGQLIVIAPSKDLVLVRLGHSDNSAESWQALGDWTTRMIGAFGDR